MLLRKENIRLVAYLGVALGVGLGAVLWGWSLRKKESSEELNGRDSVEATSGKVPLQGFQLDTGTLSATGVFVSSTPRVTNYDYKSPAADASALIKRSEGMLRQEVDGQVKVGLVSVDPQRGTISFPARMNMRSGLIEYALVNKNGKVHEALLTTEASPVHIHLAAILLQLYNPKEGNGSEVAVEVEWQPNGPVRRVPLETLIARANGVPLDPVAARAAETGGNAPREEPGESLEKGPWIYSGSNVRQGAFVAELDGSVIALVNDPSALINNPRRGNNNDRIHVPSKELPPADNFPVVIHVSRATKD